MIQAEEVGDVVPRQRTVRSGLARLGTGKPTVAGTATVPRVSSGSTSRMVSTQGGGVVGGGVQPKVSLEPTLVRLSSLLLKNRHC